MSRAHALLVSGPRVGPALLALLALVACGGGEDAADGPSVRVVLGTGLQAYEPLDSDATVPLIHGIQGAYHVWTSFLAYGFQEEVVHMQIATHWENRDESLLDLGGIVGLRDATDPSGAPATTMHGWPALVFDPVCSNGQRLVVELNVSDDAGNVATDSRTWVVQVAEEDRGADCPP